MPCVSIYGSVIVAMFLHFEGVSKTHCRPAKDNPFPSVSAAVGNYTPERWIYRIGMLFIAGQRFFDSRLMYAISSHQRDFRC